MSACIKYGSIRGGGLVALKFDISNVYDRIEWGFLENVKRKLGFSSKWIDLTMSCISSASFSVLINGAAKGMIHSQRGTRQGFPLSPYPFILCAEGFSNLLQQTEAKKMIHEVKFSNNLSISYLPFADDSLIFTRAKTEECTKLKEDFYIAMLLPLDKYSITRNPRCFLGEAPQPSKLMRLKTFSSLM